MARTIADPNLSRLKFAARSGPDSADDEQDSIAEAKRKWAAARRPKTPLQRMRQRGLISDRAMKKHLARKASNK